MKLICYLGAIAIVFAWLIALMPKHIGEEMAKADEIAAGQAANEYLETEVRKGQLVKRVRPDGRTEYAAPPVSEHDSADSPPSSK